MATAAEFAYFLGYALLVVSLFSSLRQAFKRRDRHRLDVALFQAFLFLSVLVRIPESPLGISLRLLVIFLTPYGLVRLARHFRDVGALVTTVFLLLAVIVAIVYPFAPSNSFKPVMSAVNLYIALLYGLGAAAFMAEAGRSAGVKSRRLSFAAAGTWALALTSGLTVFGTWLDLVGQHVVSRLNGFFDGLALIFFFFAFSPPHWLTGRWQRAERARYLDRTGGREPEERGRLAGEDLFRTAVRGAGGAATFVALRSAPFADRVEIVAASEAALLGLTIGPEAILATGTMQTGLPGSGPPADLGTEIASRVTAQSVQALVAPIVGTHMWGVVVVVHRRGALFPEDDLALLGQLGRAAATALDHAHLIAERRDRERQAAERRLREVESRMALMLDSIKDYAMLLLDEEGRVAVWHHGAETLFGYDAQEIGDRDATTLYDMPGTEFRAWLTEARVRGFAHREGTCRRRDQTSFIGATTIRPLVAEPGVPPGFVAVTHDVTERRALEERLRQSQKMEAVGNLAGGVAHDFNNLLSAISGYAEWLEQDLATESRQEMIAGIQQAADRGADLIRQLLTFSRRQTIQPALVNLSATVAELLPLLRRLVGAPVQIIDRTSPTLAAVLGDRGEIERVLMNLVVNARDAMPRGGHVTLRTADTWIDQPPDQEMQPGPYVVLEVEDTGTGMDTETQRRAFEPFFTTKPVGKGTGLGLSTVYGIVRQMGGSISIDSAPGRGATIRILLPRSSGISRAAASVPA